MGWLCRWRWKYFAELNFQSVDATNSYLHWPRHILTYSEWDIYRQHLHRSCAMPLSLSHNDQWLNTNAMMITDLPVIRSDQPTHAIAWFGVSISSLDVWAFSVCMCVCMYVCMYIYGCVCVFWKSLILLLCHVFEYTFWVHENIYVLCPFFFWVVIV